MDRKYQRRAQVERLFIACTVGFILLVHAWSLMRYPAPQQDEAWLVSRAWSFIQSGHQMGMLDAGLIERFDHYWIINQWTITALQSLVLRLFPAPLLLPLRVLSLLFGFILLGATYLVARQLGGRSLALVSTLLLAVSTAFFYSAHLVRYDILAAALGYSALAIILMDQRGRFIPGLVSGLLIGLAIETHLNSLIYVPAIGICLLIMHGRQIWRIGATWGWATGMLAGAIYYLCLHYFPNPETFRYLNSAIFGSTKLPPLLTLNAARIAEGLGDTLRLLLVSAGSAVLLALLAVLRLLVRKTRADILILALNFTLIITSGLLIAYKAAHYAIYLAPAFIILIAAYLIDFWKKPWRGRVWDYVERVIVWGAAAGAVALGLSTIKVDRYSNFQNTQAQVNSVVKPADVVMGPQVYWFGLPDHRYLSWEGLFFYPNFYSGMVMEDAFHYFRPDVFIINQDLLALIADNVDPASQWYSYHLSKKELDSYLAQHAVMILESKDENGGPLLIYRFVR